MTNAVIPITYGYARVSKADDDTKNLEDVLAVYTRPYPQIPLGMPG